MNLEQSQDNQDSTVTFADLPVDFLKQVVKVSALRECMALRKVNRDLRNLVDTSEIQCASINFKFKGNHSKMKFANEQVEYNTREFVETRREKGDNRYWDDGYFKEAMICDAAALLENPKLRIGHIGLEVGRDEDVAEFLEFLKSRKSPLNVRSIQSNNLNCLHSVVQVLKSGKLEKIVYDSDGFTIDQFNEIATTSELFKNPKFEIGMMRLGEYRVEVWNEFSRILNSPVYPLRLRLIRVRSEDWLGPIFRSSSLEKVEDVVLEGLDLSVTQFHELVRISRTEKAIRLNWCDVPTEIGLESMVDFKEFSSCYYYFNEIDDNLIKIRDFLVNSPCLELCSLTEFCEKDEGVEWWMNERINRLMSENPAYDAQTQRFSIPNSRDYFQLKYEKSCYTNVLTITRIFKDPSRRAA